MFQWYRKETKTSTEKNVEVCFNIQSSEQLTIRELEILKWLLGETFEPECLDLRSFLDSKDVIEVGPRMNFATAWSTNAVAICHVCGLTKITRIERSRRYKRSDEAVYDRMTECPYPKPLTTFETGVKPEPVFEIPLKEKGPDALLGIPGMAMDEFDRNLYYNYFVVQKGKNPTNVEIEDLNNANSEHSRHGYFKGTQIINGETMPETLFEIVQSTLGNPSNSIIAFKDNSSGIRGYDVWTIIPKNPGKPSKFVKKKRMYHIIFTAETHNFPTGIAPFPGAETGTGGRIRDIQATGRGGLVVAGTAGYCVANLLIPGYDLSWENKDMPYPSNLAPSLDVEIRASDGASDYGNKFGEPVIQGFTRSFDLTLLNGERWGWIKKIMFTGGIGQIDNEHIKKKKAEKGLLIVQVGGPAYSIGVGGGAASSMLQGENDAELDFNAVQRGDAEMEQKMNRVIRACVEMGKNNPIDSVHDQGAAGSSNVLKELVEEAGGRISLRNITLGDKTLSVLKIWIAEYQERNGLLIHPDRIKEFKAICEREKLNCEILGEVTGDGRFVVYDELDNTTPVDLELEKVLGGMSQKTFTDEQISPALEPLKLPEGLTVAKALLLVLKNISVGSKRFLTNKVDRSVTGLIARQQCAGPLQLTVADVAVIAQSHFGLTGAVISIGEQPIKMIVNPAAGARMAVGEALTNIVWAKISNLEDIKCSANWMWAPKLPGEGAALYGAATAMRDLMVSLGIAVDGGKDSLSMATKIDGKTVKSPRELVVSAYCTTPDVAKVITPDIKKPGESYLYYINLSSGNKRLGGSVLAHVYGQIGNDCPDIEEPELLKESFFTIQEMIDKGLILAGHDRSDGGLITTILEMLFAGNCGALVDFVSLGEKTGPIPDFFNEELGLVVEVSAHKEEEAIKLLTDRHIPWQFIGSTTKEKRVIISHKSNGKRTEVLNEDTRILRQLWEETSHQLERLQANPKCADEEKKNIFDRTGPKYHLTFDPENTAPAILEAKEKPKVAIIREEGSNSDREMTSAFYQAGFEPWDITMSDLLKGQIALYMFRGIAFVGGFSYADVLGSAKGWAGSIRFNERLRDQLQHFHNRQNTFSLGICNGCQLMALLGWIPGIPVPDEKQPRFIKNTSGRFESRFSSVQILPSSAIMLQGMEGSVLGAWVAHGEGRAYFPDKKILEEVKKNNLAPIRYVDDENLITQAYPFNPNGSANGIAALCSPDGRHLAIMPHPERTFLKWQWPWMPEEWTKNLKASPWIKMFQNARIWCEKN